MQEKGQAKWTHMQCTRLLGAVHLYVEHDRKLCISNVAQPMGKCGRSVVRQKRRRRRRWRLDMVFGLFHSAFIFRPIFFVHFNFFNFSFSSQFGRPRLSIIAEPQIKKIKTFKREDLSWVTHIHIQTKWHMSSVLQVLGRHALHFESQRPRLTVSVVVMQLFFIVVVGGGAPRTLHVCKALGR